MNNINNSLKNLLKEKNKNHSIFILKLDNIKDALIYCKINKLSGPKMGCLIEKYILNKYKIKKNKAKLCNGDFSVNNNNIELKVSLGGNLNNKFNFVQLRPSHNVNTYILICYYINISNININGEEYIFYIPKNNMIELIKSNGTYAHGTIKKLGKINDILDNVEYALRTKYNDSLWNKLLNFQIKDLSIYI